LRRVTVVSFQSLTKSWQRFYTEQVGFEFLAEARFGDNLRWIQGGRVDDARGRASLSSGRAHHLS
jgi:hypothetical protein